MSHDLSEPPTVETLLAALNDKGSVVRCQAARALGEIREARALDPLIALLKHSDKNTQIAAAQALGKLGDSRAIQPLSTALQHEYFETYDAIKEALASLGATGIVATQEAARAKSAEIEDAKRTGTPLLIWGAGLLTIGLLSTFVSYFSGSRNPVRAGNVEMFTYTVFEAPMVLGGILLAIGILRSFGVKDWVKGGVSIVFVGFLAAIDAFTLISHAFQLTAESPIFTPLTFVALIAGFVLAIYMATRPWRDVFVASGGFIVLSFVLANL